MRINSRSRDASDSFRGRVEVLEYQTQLPAKTRLGVALITLPVVASAVALAVFGQDLLEDTYEGIADAVVHVGGPLLVFVLWIASAVVAIRCRLPRRPGLPLLLALVLCWAALTSWVMQWVMMKYLHEMGAL